MPSLKAIRNRISSVRSTQKITRAMKMVAGARLARAQQRIVALRPYAVKTGEILQQVTGGNQAADSNVELSEMAMVNAAHPLLARRPVANVLIVVMSSDRGLCGGFNTNIFKGVERTWKAQVAAGMSVEFATCGRKGREYIQRRGGIVAHDFAQVYDGLSMVKATLVADWIVRRFQTAKYDAVHIIYTQFKSAITQKVTVDQLLPVGAGNEAAAQVKTVENASQASEFLFEPNQGALLERLVPMYMEISIYRALLDSQASEFGARMTAMDAATRNAKEMIGRLTLVYNRARQAAITKELMEIIGGAEALKD